ncbi:hypothetical protein GCM10010464_54620 [Pseudonocardia yunnanensis]
MGRLDDGGESQAGDRADSFPNSVWVGKASAQRQLSAALEQYEDLGLQRWAHMLGFRGHFLTKSQRYSTTFGALRHGRRTWRLAEDLAQLDRDTDDPNTISLDLTTITVVNDWRLVHIGHRTYAERELAVAIAERNRQQRKSRTTQRRTA